MLISLSLDWRHCSADYSYRSVKLKQKVNRWQQEKCFMVKKKNTPPIGQICVHTCMCSVGSVLSDSAIHGLQLTRLLCPWNSLGKNTGVDSCSLLQRILLTQGLNSGLPYCRQILYHLSHQGSPFKKDSWFFQE